MTRSGADLTTDVATLRGINLAVRDCVFQS